MQTSSAEAQAAGSSPGTTMTVSVSVPAPMVHSPTTASRGQSCPPTNRPGSAATTGAAQSVRAASTSQPTPVQSLHSGALEKGFS